MFVVFGIGLGLIEHVLQGVPAMMVREHKNLNRQILIKLKFNYTHNGALLTVLLATISKDNVN